MPNFISRSFSGVIGIIPSFRGTSQGEIRRQWICGNMRTL